MTTSQIAMCHFDSCFDCIICNLNMVVFLISCLQATQDSHTISHTRLFNHHFCKSARKGRIFFDVFLVFFLSSRSDSPQSSTCQGRFQDIGRIQGRINTTSRPHNSMELIDKDNNLTVFLNIFDDIVHTFFKVSTETGPRNHIHQIKL